MDLWERVLAFMDAQAVLTAHARRLFDVLGRGPMTAPEIARRVNAWIRRYGFVWQRTYPAPFGKHYMVARRER